MSRHRHPRPNRIATNSVELAFAVPQVLAHRMARMALAGPLPSLRDRKEFMLMGTEKVAAFYESWMAMWLAAVRANAALFASPLLWWSTTTAPAALGFRMSPARAHRTALTILGSGVAPVHRRAVANAKRLRRELRAR
jgi:hypothetical protein